MRPLTAEEWEAKPTSTMFMAGTVLRDTRDGSLWEFQYVQDQTGPVVVWLAEAGGGMYFSETSEDLMAYYTFSDNRPCGMEVE